MYFALVCVVLMILYGIMLDEGSTAGKSHVVPDDLYRQFKTQFSVPGIWIFIRIYGVIRIIPSGWRLTFTDWVKIGHFRAIV